MIWNFRLASIVFSAYLIASYATYASPLSKKLLTSSNTIKQSAQNGYGNYKYVIDVVGGAGLMNYNFNSGDSNTGFYNKTHGRMSVGTIGGEFYHLDKKTLVGLFVASLSAKNDSSYYLSNALDGTPIINQYSNETTSEAITLFITRYFSKNSPLSITAFGNLMFSATDVTMIPGAMCSNCANGAKVGANFDSTNRSAGFLINKVIEKKKWLFSAMASVAYSNTKNDGYTLNNTVIRPLTVSQYQLNIGGQLTRKVSEKFRPFASFNYINGFSRKFNYNFIPATAATMPQLLVALHGYQAGVGASIKIRIFELTPGYKFAELGSTFKSHTFFLGVKFRP